MKKISPFTIIVIFAALSLTGISLLPLLPVKLQPEEQLPSVAVCFQMYGASSKVVETGVTSILESGFAKMRGVKNITSVSRNGSGEVRISFDSHADISAVRFEISSLVRQMWPSLPKGVSYPEIIVSKSSDNNSEVFLSYTVNAQNNIDEIGTCVKKVFQTGFSDIEGVKSVDIYAGNGYDYNLKFNNTAVTNSGISPWDIRSQISDYTFKTNVGKYQLSDGKADSVFSVDNLYVTNGDTALINLGRILTPEFSEKTPSYIERINGLNSVYINFSATKTANQLKLRQLVEERMSQLKSKLPAGYQIHKVYDAAEYISDELEKICYRSLLTILILLVFVLVTTFSFRRTIVVVSSLCCNLAIAFIFYYILGVELQLYSLAGITISLNLMIDNTIIMSDHWKRNRNLKAVLPIVASTLTTAGSLMIVFFFDEKLRLNLYDFAVVIIVNLLISIFTSLWLVPSVMQLQKEEKSQKKRRRYMRFAVVMSRGYLFVTRFVVKHKRIAIIISILGFGLPLFKMPDKVEETGFWSICYNKIFGSQVYSQKIRPITDVALGGSLRLFVEKVYEGSYFRDNNEVVLHIQASLPYGSTISQMDYLIRQMENHLSKQPEIRLFKSSFGPTYGSIEVYFTKEAGKTAFPYILKSEVISKGLQLGGGSWTVYGLQDQGFSNDVMEQNGSYILSMKGYNYENLLRYSDTLKNWLLQHKRIKEVNINSRPSYYKSDYTEYHLKPKSEVMIRENILPAHLFYALSCLFISREQLAAVYSNNSFNDIVLQTSESENYDIWSLLNYPVNIGGRQYKVSDLCDFEKTSSAQDIVRENQEYLLSLQYEYIGSNVMGDKISKEADSLFSVYLPAGYSVDYDKYRYYWGDNSGRQYLLLGVVVAIIFFLTSILFNSLRLPLIILSVLPFAFIGLFLTFYLFGLNFDQGGFAAMVLLCGITVNAAIYILNEYQHQLKYKHRKLLSFVKSVDIKVIPVFLTVISTILGFIPFMTGEKESFWFALAAGTTGGLLVSVIGIFVLLPALVLKRKEVEKEVG